MELLKSTDSETGWFLFIDESDPGQEFKMPTKRCVCGNCDGYGVHTNQSIDGRGLSADDFSSDPDFYYDYKNGKYDVICHECHGERVVDEIDVDSLSPELQKAYQNYIDEKAAYESERAMELRMFC